VEERACEGGVVDIGGDGTGEEEVEEDEERRGGKGGAKRRAETAEEDEVGRKEGKERKSMNLWR